MRCAYPSLYMAFFFFNALGSLFLAIAALVLIAYVLVWNHRLRREVDERKAVEAKVRIANDRLGIAQEAGNVGVFDLEFTTGKNYWTPQLERIFGLQEGEFGGSEEAWGAAIYPEDRERATSYFRQVVEGDAMSCSDKFRIQRPDGTVRWLHSLSRISRGPDGRALGAVGVCIDVTELVHARNEAENATRANRCFLPT